MAKSKVTSPIQLLGLIVAVAVITAVVKSPNAGTSIIGLGAGFQSILRGASGGTP
jgi:hypothetical protein